MSESYQNNPDFENLTALIGGKILKLESVEVNDLIGQIIAKAGLYGGRVYMSSSISIDGGKEFYTQRADESFEEMSDRIRALGTQLLKERTMMIVNFTIDVLDRAEKKGADENALAILKMSMSDVIADMAKVKEAK